MNPLDDELAIRGGRPVRDKMLPYGRQTIDEDDRAAVDAVLRSDWLTTGPKVAEFEQAFANYVGAPEAVAVSSGTAALHAAMDALEIGPGDEVIVPAMTFAATANAVVYLGGTPIFADVDADTLLLTAESAAPHITPRTKAIVAVDYAGQPCDYDPLRELAHGRRADSACRSCDDEVARTAAHSSSAAGFFAGSGRVGRCPGGPYQAVKWVCTRARRRGRAALLDTPVASVVESGRHSAPARSGRWNRARAKESV